MKNPIIAALDVPTAIEALALASKLKGVVGGVKVGSELFTSAGPEIVRRIRETGLPVFLDLKFHDIPNTAAKVVAAATRLGVWMMNVHASGGLEMMAAAKKSVKDAGSKFEVLPLLLGVTVLTSFDDDGLHAIGIPSTTLHQVARLTRLAIRAKLDGLVCSPLEVVAVRALVPEGTQLVVPGIRLPEAGKQDQKRTGTPKQAMADGADWLVIGRPIYGAEDPRQAAEEILASLN